MSSQIGWSHFCDIPESEHLSLKHNLRKQQKFGLCDLKTPAPNYDQPLHIPGGKEPSTVKKPFFETVKQLRGNDTFHSLALLLSSAHIQLLSFFSDTLSLCGRGGKKRTNGLPNLLVIELCHCLHCIFMALKIYECKWALLLVHPQHRAGDWSNLPEKGLQFILAKWQQKLAACKPWTNTSVMPFFSSLR